MVAVGSIMITGGAVEGMDVAGRTEEGGKVDIGGVLFYPIKYIVNRPFRVKSADKYRINIGIQRFIDAI